MTISTSGIARSADGIPIAYEAAGSGLPALVFVHGWTGNREIWRAQRAHFASRAAVVALDLAGHGESGGGRDRWTMAAFGRDVAAVLDALDLGDAVLVGHSMGGPVILEAALAAPSRVRGLVPVDALQNMAAEAKPGAADAFEARFRSDYEAAVRSFMRRLFAPATDGVLAASLISGALAADREMAIGALRSSWYYDARPALARVRSPIHAINSDLFPTKIEENRRVVPAFEASIVAGVGHYPMIEAPDRFNAVLEEVLRGWERRGER